MINAFNSLTEYKFEDWEQYLDNLMLYEIFEDVIKAYPNKSHLKTVIRYILYAYSVESDKVQIGADWEDNKKRIYDFVHGQQNKELLDQLVYLQHPAVTKTVHKWLEHQDMPVYKSLQSLKDLRLEMQLACNSPLRKNTGEIDFDQKFKNTQHIKELDKMIKDLESELIQNSPKLKEAVREVKTTGEKNSRSVGSYAV